MPQLMLFAENALDSAAPGSPAPTAAQIEAALRAIPIVEQRALRQARGELDYGGWVGSARVTRAATLTLTPLSPNRFTRVAWLYEYPDPPGRTAAQRAQVDASLRDYLRTHARTALEAIPGQGSRWRTVEVLDYAPATHGERWFWTCERGTTPEQCAATTRTRDAFDLNQQVGGTSTVENPAGPQHVAPPANFDPTTPLPSGPKLPDLTKFLITAGVVLGTGTALYLAWPALAAARARIAARERARRAA